MQIGVEDQPLAEILILRLNGLLYLDDHVGAAPHLPGLLQDPGPGSGILAVGIADGGAGAALHQDSVSGLDKGGDAVRRQSHAVLIVLDLFWKSDYHGVLLLFSKFLAANLSSLQISARFQPRMGVPGCAGGPAPPPISAEAIRSARKG